MKQKKSTYKHAHKYCPKCRTNKYTLLDEHHAEIYCDKCGLIIQDTSINTICDYIRLKKYNEKQLYRLHHKKIRDSPRA